MEDSADENNANVSPRRSSRLREKQKHLPQTPTRAEIRKKIDEDYRFGLRSGKSIRQLQMQRRAPNDFVVAEYRYNTDTHDPLESETLSLASFVVSDDNVDDESSERSEADDSDVQSASGGISHEVINSSGGDEGEEPANGDDNSDADNVQRFRTNWRSAAVVIQSDIDDDHDEEEDEEDESPILLRRSKPRAGDTTKNSPNQSSIYPYLQIDRSVSPVSISSSSSADEAVRENILWAPKKKRRLDDEEIQRDDGETPIRRSARVASNEAKRETAKRTLFGPYCDERERFFSKLAKNSYVEQPEQVDEGEVVLVLDNDKVDTDSGVCPLGSLENVLDGQLVTVRGKIVTCGDSDTRPVRAGSTFRVDVRQIVLRDPTGDVNITLWRDHAFNGQVALDAFIEMQGLKKNTYQNLPNLSTYYHTSIKTFEPPADYEESLSLVKLSRWCYILSQIDPWRTYVYNACAECFTKTEPTTNGRRERVCKKCKHRFAIADTDVGVAMRAVFEDQATGEVEFGTIFTSSLRKLCQDLPVKWGDHEESEEHVRDQLKERIIRTVEAVLPCAVTCTENGRGNWTILRVGDKVNA